MKKFVYLLLLSIFVSSLALFGGMRSAGAVTTVQDQACVTSPGGWTNVSLHRYLNENFQPALDTLTKVTLSLGGSGSFTFGIWDNSFTTKLYETVVTINAPGTKDISFAPITVVPGNNYNLHFNQSTTGQESWRYSTSVLCNTHGNATMGDSQDANVKDFFFTTWGYNASSGSQEQAADQSSSDQSSSNQTAQDAANQKPATTTSSTIAALTSLKAVDVPNDNGGAIQINWIASTTTDIDGYKIFRSTTNGDADFLSIAQVTKDSPSYVDQKATTGQKYYYFARAYKGTDESADSNHVNQTSINNLAKATTSSWWSKYHLYVYIGGGVLLAGLIVLVIVLVTRKPKKI